MIVTFRMKIERAETWNVVSEIQNRYWQIRALRPGDESKRRQLYREIKIANDELIKRGADRIELHHWKRSLASHKTTNSTTAESLYQARITRLKANGKTPITETKFTYARAA